MKTLFLTFLSLFFTFTAPAFAADSFTATKTGLKIHDVKVGTGTEAAPGKRVTVHYTGWLWEHEQKGTQFDSSLSRGQPFAFHLGMGQVISGWEEGVAGMKVGGTRELIIPAELGYGTRGAGKVIPPNAKLFFEVQLLNVE